MNGKFGNGWAQPGARYWKFDFHAHTPASRDAYFAESEPVTPEAWLKKFMDAGIDCVAITDHNSGDWIDGLKNAYSKMEQLSASGLAPSGFRKLTIFPGVEISVQGGFHLLAIFDPSRGASEIDQLLDRVGYRGSKGECDEVANMGGSEIVREVIESGGIPIPAHSDRPGKNGRGLLAFREKSQKTVVDPIIVQRVMRSPGLTAIEWEEECRRAPEIVSNEFQKLSRVVGSDCHRLQGENCPGSRFTWIKMALPTLEGLRLALLDGNGVSVFRSDELEFDPFRTPSHFICRLEVRSARFMGNGKPAVMDFAPYYNALIGGRGTGKSTTVEAIRLAYRRGNELNRLGSSAHPVLQFNRFSEIAVGRNDVGALRDNTAITVDLVKDGIAQRLHWRYGGKGSVVQELDDDNRWKDSTSQEVSPERFPIRLFSQGQIAAMAGEGRQALLDIIDETAEIGDLHEKLIEAQRKFFSKRALFRELNGKLAKQSEVERKLADAKNKINRTTGSRHAEILKSYQLSQKNRRKLDETLLQLEETAHRIGEFARNLVLDDWPTGIFVEKVDEDMLAWKRDADRSVIEARNSIEEASTSLTESVENLQRVEKLEAWRERTRQAEADFKVLQQELRNSNLSEPGEFEVIIQERNRLESELMRFELVRKDLRRLANEVECQLHLVEKARSAITEARANFIEQKLKGNRFIRMEVVKFGFEPTKIEDSLLALVDFQDGRYPRDIFQSEPYDLPSGLAHELAYSADRDAQLKKIKNEIVDANSEFGGTFRQFLAKKLEKPEFEDYIRCWFPNDDLRIEYSRGGDGHSWAPIEQGSQGQRSAALLAFFLAFGDEPLILDQPEDDLDNHLIYELIVRQIRENKLRRQLIVATHNANIAINGDAEMVHAFEFQGGQCQVAKHGALQESEIRNEVCEIMEGGREAFAKRWARLGREI